MKLEYISVSGFGVLVDSITPSKDYQGYYYLNGKIYHTDKYMLQTGCQSVLLAERELNLNIPILPNWKQWEVKQLSRKYSIKRFENSDCQESFDQSITETDFIAGYNQNKAKYTEEDLRKAYYHNTNEGYNDNKLIEQSESLVLFLRSFEKLPKCIVMDSQRVRLPKGGDGWVDVYQPVLTTSTEDEKEMGIIKKIIY